MRFLPKFPQRSWEKSVFGAFGRGIPPPEAIVLNFLQGFWASGRAGEGRWGESARADPPRGRAREALRKSFPRHCENRFPPSRDARGKTVNEKPARGLPHDNGPRRVGCAFCAFCLARFAQNRSEMSRIDHKRSSLRHACRGIIAP